MHEHGHYDARTHRSRNNVTPYQRQKRIAVANIPSYLKREVSNRTDERRTVWVLPPEVFSEFLPIAHGTSQPLSYGLWRHGGVDMKTVERHRILRTLSVEKPDELTSLILCV